MAQVPTFLRRWIVANGPDDDWAGTQVSPPSTLLVNLKGSKQRIGINWIPYEEDGFGNSFPSTGTIDLQLVTADTPEKYQGKTLSPVVMGTPTDAGVNVGEGLEYNVGGIRNFTMRVVGTTTPGTYVDLYWRILEG